MFTLKHVPDCVCSTNVFIVCIHNVKRMFFILGYKVTTAARAIIN